MTDQRPGFDDEQSWRDEEDWNDPPGTWEDADEPEPEDDDNHAREPTTGHAFGTSLLLGAGIAAVYTGHMDHALVILGLLVVYDVGKTWATEP